MRSMRKIIVIALALLCPVVPSLYAVPDATQKTVLSQSLLSQATGLKPEVLEYALKANCAAEKQGVVKHGNVLTIVDFSLPSSQKRLWTFDLTTRHLLFQEYVAHGKNSGENRTVTFSNDKESLMSSLGVYLTDVPYIGKNGYSMRLVGLEKRYNDNVYTRAVVLHGAWYVSEDMIRTYGRLGRSYGCPAVR